MAVRQRIVIDNGRLIDPASGLDRKASLYVDGDRIAAIGKPPRGFKAGRVIDAAGCIVAPGLVELSAHLREPGAEHKATIRSETRAALRAGITTLCCPPDTDPVIDTPAVVELINHRVSLAGASRVICLGALTQNLAGERLSEMFALKRIGCAGVSNGDRPVADARFMRRALEYAATCGMTVFIRPLDATLAGDGCVHEGPVSLRLGLPGIPATAETVALSRDLLLIEQTGARAHFCRLSCARSVELLAQAQARGLPVTADVGIYHLLFTDQELLGFDSRFHLQPPLRSAADREALRAGVAEGVVQAICADHQPHEHDAKEAPFVATAPGISGLETFVPLGLELVAQKLLTLPRLIDALATQPARILGIRAGRLAVGEPADICVLDPKLRWRLEAGTQSSRGENTPYLGQTLTGRAVQVLLGGQPLDRLERRWRR